MLKAANLKLRPKGVILSGGPASNYQDAGPLRCLGQDIRGADLRYLQGDKPRGAPPLATSSQAGSGTWQCDHHPVAPHHLDVTVISYQGLSVAVKSHHNVSGYSRKW